MEPNTASRFLPRRGGLIRATYETAGKLRHQVIRQRRQPGQARETGGPWGSRPPRAPEEILVSDEAVARARAVDRLRRLLDAARYGRRAPDPTDFTYGSPTPMMAGGCLRAVLLIMLFFLLVSFLGLANFGILMRGY